MNERSSQIATICECIDHCFAFAIWCDDFANSVNPEDMMWGLDRGADLVSDATRLQSFLALRKLDDFFAEVKPKPDDLVASKLDIDVPSVLGELGESFLTQAERTDINKCVAHLTERLSLDPDSEIDLQEIVRRSIPVLSRFVVALRAIDTDQEAGHWLDRSEALIERGQGR